MRVRTALILAGLGVAGLVLFPAPAHPVSRTDAANTVITNVISPHPGAAVLNAFAPQAAIPAGTVIEDGFAGETLLTPSAPSWLFWLDLAPFADFQHATIYVLVDTTTGAIAAQADGVWWPRIGGVERYRNESERTAGAPDLVYSGGGFEPAPLRDRDDARARPAPAPRLAPDPTAGKWALIISGEDTLANARRQANVDSIRTAYRQVFGVPAGNITVSNNPDSAALWAAIAGLPDDCPKLYVYFTGHGFNGGFVTNNVRVRAADFAAKLKAENAAEYCVFLSQCHSGSFLPVFRDSGLTGFHVAGADPDSLAFGWSPGQNTWVGNFLEHFWMGCIRSGLRGQAAFAWARDSLKSYLDSLKMAHPNWVKGGAIQCSNPVSNQVFVHDQPGDLTIIEAPPGTGTVCVNWKPGPADVCANVSLYCEVVVAPNDTTWRLAKHWNWNQGQSRYVRPFGQPGATGRYRLLAHSNRYPTCGDITFTNALIAESPTSARIFPAYTVGWRDGTGAEYCVPPPGLVNFDVGMQLDQIPRVIGQQGPASATLDIGFELEPDPLRPWLYQNGDPQMGFDGFSLVFLEVADIRDPNGAPVNLLPIEVTFIQGTDVRPLTTFAQRTPDGIFTDPLFVGSIRPEPFELLFDVPGGTPEPGVQGPGGGGQFELDAFTFVTETFGTVDVAPPAQVATLALAIEPNPFAASARIGLALPDRARVRIEVFDLAGRRLAGLADGVLPAGRHVVTWDGRDGSGAPVATGVYVVRARTGGATAVAKLVRVR